MSMGRVYSEWNLWSLLVVCIVESVVCSQSPKIYTLNAFFLQTPLIIYSIPLRILHHLLPLIIYLFTVQ